MRIEDVKVGDVVIPRPWSGHHRAVGELNSRSRACNTLRRVVRVDASDFTVELDCSPDGLGLTWWPAEFCESTNTTSTFATALKAEANKPDQSNATQLLIQLHAREKAELQQQLALALKTADRVAQQEMLLDREVTTLRSQIAALEKQVADLKSERDRVGKTSQTGTRFAQLELD